MVSRFLITFITVLLASCGGTSQETNVPTGSIPVLLTAQPATVARGAQVTLRGVGFSLVAQENVISIGGVSTTAKKYEISKEGGEAITFEIPSTVPAGTNSLVVTVLGDTSNKLTITINP